MGKTLYLLILLIINSALWNLSFVQWSSDDWLVLQLSYLIVGFVCFGKFENFSLFSKELKYWWLWVFGVFLSMLPAYLNYGQTLSQSIITYRTHFLLVQIPILFKIAPTKEEIVKAIMVFFIFLWLVLYLQSLNPFFANLNEDTPIIGGGMVAGWFFVIIALFYYLDRIKEKFSIKILLTIFLIFIFAYIEQNRSILFSITAIIGWTMLKIKKNRVLMVLTIALLSIVVIYYTADTWVALFEETAEQVGSDKYNRNKAYQYYFFEACPNMYSYILGNGFLSAHTTSNMQDMMDVGVYNSDVGFVGYWNQFGILPIFVFLSMLIPAVIGKKNSHFIRCWALQILICSLTISYWHGGNLLYMSLFYYLYFTDLKDQEEQMDEAELIENVEIAEI